MPRVNRFKRSRSRRRGGKSKYGRPRSRSSLAISRPMRMNATGYLKIKQKVAQQLAVPVSSAELGTAFTFKLSDLLQATEFVRLFDSYRINGVKMTAAPLTNSDITINPSYKIMTAIDLDDDVTPTVPEMLQRSNVKIRTVTSGGNNPQVFSTFVRPRYLTQIYETPTSTGYGQGARKQWLDCADPTIPHYGLKVVFDTDPNLNYEVIWQFYFTYYVEFKSLR